MLRSGLCVLIFMMLTTTVVSEDQPSVGKLPPSGTWITYQVIQSGQPKEMSVYSTLRILERVTREEEQCVWIETDHVLDDGKQVQRYVHRYLFPEKALLESKEPFLKLKEWQYGTSRPRSTENDKPPQIFLEDGTIVTPEVRKVMNKTGWGLINFPGVWKTADQVHAKTKIGYERGTLNCVRDLVGEKVDEFQGLRPGTKDDEETTRRVVKYRAHWNSSVPLGIAGVEFEFEKTRIDAAGNPLGDPEKNTLQWLLDDFGTNARSAFEIK